MSIQIHTRKWVGDQSVTDQMKADGVQAEASLQCRVFIDGHEVRGCKMARPLYRNGFATVTLRICDEVEVINHTDESWRELS